MNAISAPPINVSFERRKRPRLHVRWPIRILRSDALDPEETVTHDLSSEGCYFIAKGAFVPGQTRTCILSMPSHDQHGVRLLPIECQVRVIRVETLAADGSLGIGCRIEDYRFLQRSSGDSGAAMEPCDARRILTEKLAASEGQTRQ
jgi:hypothetical protein